MPTVQTCAVVLTAPGSLLCCLPRVVTFGRQLLVGAYIVIALGSRTHRLSPDVLRGRVTVSETGALSVGGYTFVGRSADVDQTTLDGLILARRAPGVQIARVQNRYYLCAPIGHDVDGCGLIVSELGEPAWLELPDVTQPCWSCSVDRGGWRCVNGRMLVYVISPGLPVGVQDTNTQVDDSGRVRLNGSRVGLHPELTDRLAIFVRDHCHTTCICTDASGNPIAVVIPRREDWIISDWCEDHIS